MHNPYYPGLPRNRKHPSSFKAFVLGIILGGFSWACGHQLQVETAKSRMFEEDVATCRAYSDNCPDFVICQHNAQRQYGYPMTGKCKGPALSDVVQDAGRD